MNTDNILFEVIHTLQRVFPEFEYTLMLSTDYSYNPKLPIQSFEYDSIDELAMEAYVSGSIQIATTIKNTRTLLYAPLRGRQGVYGVLQVAALAKHMFEKSDVEFIHLLATTAGNALENAKLYQKSMSSIEDLRLINTISQQLNSRTNLKETIQFLFSQIADAFNVSEIGFVLAQDNQYEILPGSSSIFEENEGRACIDRIYQQFLKKHEPLFISDLHKRYPQYRFRFASIMAIPMVQENSLEGFCVALHEDAYHFTFEMFKLFQSIIHHSTMALVNAMLREKLEKMVITDHLTQLFSKNYLNSRIEQSMKTDRQGTFILLDIDDFKKVNDTYGHQVGDEVLIQVAKLIRKNIRSTDVGARWGGEEMAIYLPEVSLKIGEKIAKRILKAVENHTKPPITISCGISYWSNVSEKVEKLFNRADAGLYHAKHLGKNRIVINH
ncbi:sensor domain-containing diguanylate cyclase [Heyndrickxia ginsengihumi]|nr:sensor domain-containing diguanylate cyclase [Heyndrickxia ginsengihumi]